MPALKVFIRYVVIGLALALQPFVAHGAASQAWPQPPSQLSLDSPYGTLQVSQSDYVYEARLQLDAKTIEPELKGMINIPYAFKQANNQTALISVDKGLGACSINYHWVTVSSQGYTVSPAFGSCSAKIRVRHHGRTLIMETPSQDNPAMIDEYRYDGRKISLRKRRPLMQ
ncbi:hypothetical protein ACYB9R_06550 [Alcaligenes aquatilis]|jgi:hypothetical protein|uniref:Uncharacterized protein n=2 Tax=Alcaligenes TaxID=507 RepID=A0AB33CVI8_ALCFA|nr:MULTISPECIES: hypothetical protein [Alcaligenes]ASR90204.1 hypothetical protein AFA_12505 [Alcaligenes faecalis]AWG34966.1 hypothetical protein CA948_07480 [Alcaligenes aquatilis]MCC9162091.1 hypothetical protein [Alcaligenes sp. MMA]MCH4224335.1 hypothetical protein [Alcaligenes faecalis]UQN34916.1 hypothetical protein MTR80_11440 [Alcaligenes aquatilis]